jgi:hypothetical protein
MLSALPICINAAGWGIPVRFTDCVPDFQSIDPFSKTQ